MKGFVNVTDGVTKTCFELWRSVGGQEAMPPAKASHVMDYDRKSLGRGIPYSPTRKIDALALATP